MKYIRLLSMAMAAVLLFSFAACTDRGGETHTTAGEDPSASLPSETSPDTDGDTDSAQSAHTHTQGIQT